MDSKGREFRLVHHDARIRGQDYERIVAAAFSQYWERQDVRDEVVTEESGKVVLLPTGTCVRRHFSVFKMLNQSPALTSALGRAFSHQLNEVFRGDRATLVLDQPASRHIAHALLEGASCEYEIFTLDELARQLPATRNVMLFADSIFKGDTARRAIEEIRLLNYRVARVIAGADLRGDRSDKHLDGLPFVPLVSPSDFAADPVANPGDDERIQTDSITNVPLRGVASTFVDLTEHPERRTFLAEHPELSCVGFQLRGGRTHTFSLPISRMLAQATGPEQLANWLAESIINSSERLGKRVKGRDVVMFSWFESRIGSVVERVAARLREPRSDASGVFSVRMPVVYRGSDTVYPRAGSDPLAGCSEVATGRFAFANRRRPGEGYIAVYLGDSAVTGNSLREFLNRLSTAAKPAASAVLTIVGVNRLSPAEVRFFDLCPELVGNERRALPFAYDYLFTLQIRSRPGEGPIWNSLFESVITDPSLRIAELRNYIDEIHNRAERLNSTQPLLHLFCPGVAPVVVSAEVVRFRHLLALNQQNEPVVIEIVSLLDRLTSEASEDPTLLAILALEPALLLDPPLRQFGREAILRLARRVLNRADAPLPLKSDALTVIAGYPGGLKHTLRSIASSVFGESILRRQLAVLLLVQQRQLPDSAAALVEACLKGLTPEQQRFAEHLRHIVTVCSELQRAHREPQRDRHFRDVIQRLGNHLLHHSETLESEWDGAAFQLFSLTEEWDRHGGRNRKAEALETISRACDFAEKTVLPAYSALAYFARGQGNTKLADELEDGEVKAQKLLSAVRRQRPKDANTLTKDAALALSKAFEQLRKATWLSPSAERLPRADFSTTAVGALPLALHQIFASPPNLMANLAEDIFGDSSAFSGVVEFVGRGISNLLTVCPVPTHTLRHIFRQLLVNIERHGKRNDLSVQVPSGFPRIEQDGNRSWAVEIINAFDGKPVGEGQGLNTARSTGAQYGIRIESDELESGKTWRTLIEVPHCFSFHRLIQPSTP